MPQASSRLQRIWHNGFAGYDEGAIKYLQERGYTLTRKYQWVPPDREPTDQELDAIDYLIGEWDFGGVLVKIDLGLTPQGNSPAEPQEK